MGNRKNIFDMSKNLPLLPRFVTDVSEFWRVIYGSQSIIYGCLRLTTIWRSARNRKKNPCMWTRYKWCLMAHEMGLLVPKTFAFKVSWLLWQISSSRHHLMFWHAMQSWDLDPGDQSFSHDLWEIGHIINRVVVYFMSTNEQRAPGHCDTIPLKCFMH